MIALVTGASSGIGKDISIELAKKGYDIIAVARNEERLMKLKNDIENNYKVNCTYKIVELDNRQSCFKLYEDVKNEFDNIDILINNAGFGLCGKFLETELDKEINMIDTNITSLHILTKLFVKDMVEQDRGYIMNVASIAGFMAGPLMATYYSTKNYVVRLSQALRYELKAQNSNVKISCLCPGPVDTNFNKVANVKFSLKGANSADVAKYAVKKMFKNKFFILPGIGIKCTKFFAKIIPDNIMSSFCYKMQNKKLDD